jgi:hypothetical protein
MADRNQTSNAESAQVNCVAMIANLEGRLNISAPFDVRIESTLPVLSTRLRMIEVHVARESLPAVAPWVEVTWESLALRIWSADAKLRRHRPVVVVTPSDNITTTASKTFTGEKGPVDWAMAPHLPPLISMEMLRETCIDLGLRYQRQPISPDVPSFLWSLTHRLGYSHRRDAKEESKDEDAKLLDLIRQTTFYIAGLNDYTFSKVPRTQTEVYTALIELAMRFAMNKKATTRTFPVLLPPPPPPNWAAGRGARTPCCDCCACVCHEAENGKGRASLDGSYSSASRTVTWEKTRWYNKRLSLATWVKRLACWKGPKGEDDD